MFLNSYYMVEKEVLKKEKTTNYKKKIATDNEIEKEKKLSKLLSKTK